MGDDRAFAVRDELADKRAGTRTPWGTGQEQRSLAGAANLADATARRGGAPGSWAFEDGLDEEFSGPRCRRAGPSRSWSRARPSLLR